MAQCNREKDALAFSGIVLINSGLATVFASVESGKMYSI